MSNKTHSEFQVKLEGIKLSDDAERRIEKGMQALVLQELASYTPNPDGPDKPRFPYSRTGGAVIVVPIKWPGYWLRLLSEKEFQNIGQIVKVGPAIGG